MTYHTPDVEAPAADAPAEDSREIEITEEMELAGAKILEEYCGEATDWWSRYLAKKIFLEMLDAYQSK